MIYLSYNSRLFLLYMYQSSSAIYLGDLNLTLDLVIDLNILTQIDPKVFKSTNFDRTRTRFFEEKCVTDRQTEGRMDERLRPIPQYTSITLGIMTINLFMKQLILGAWCLGIGKRLNLPTCGCQIA